jgi:hypothetical protein
MAMKSAFASQHSGLSRKEITELNRYQQSLARRSRDTTAPSPGSMINPIGWRLTAVSAGAVAAVGSAVVLASGTSLPIDGLCCRYLSSGLAGGTAPPAAAPLTGIGPATGLVADSRLTTAMAPVGKLDNGLPVYSFRYVWDDQSWVGLLADDLQKRADTNSAVLILPNGLHGIDYKALGLRLATLEDWQRDGVKALQAGYQSASRRSKQKQPVTLVNRSVPPPAERTVDTAMETGSLR